MTTTKPLPLYLCHKKVRALKITIIATTNGRVTIVPEDKTYAAFEVTHEWYRRHQPEPGGYYVLYDDGYVSYSPATAFEDGYTLTAES